MIVKIFVLILLTTSFVCIYAQSEKIVKTKSNEIKISLIVEKTNWVKGEKMPVTIEIKSSSKVKINFDLKSLRFQFTPVEGNFTKTFIVPTNKLVDKKYQVKLRSGEIVYRKFELSELPFLEFDSTNSSRNFGEIPNGKYKLTIFSESPIENNSVILINFSN